MSQIKYIGRSTDFCGLTLWEILASLRGFGVGRCIKRNRFDRYGSPCYYKIQNVRAVEEVEDGRRIDVVTSKTWRGVTLTKNVSLYKSSYKADCILIPKKDDVHYRANEQPYENITVEKSKVNIDYPPFLKELVGQKLSECRTK